MSKNKASFGHMLLRGALIFNPVLVQIVGICPVVAASTSIASSALLAFVFSAEMIITCVIASAAMKDIPRDIRVVLYLLFGLAVVCPIMYLLESKAGLVFSMSTSIYLPLIAINSVTALHCEKFSVRNSVRDSFYDALAVSIGYSSIFIIVGAIREYLGNGTIAGHAVAVAQKLPGMLMPFGSLIILGYLAMALKWYISKAYPEYIQGTIMKIQNTSFKLKREQKPSATEPAQPEPALPEETEETSAPSKEKAPYEEPEKSQQEGPEPAIPENSPESEPKQESAPQSEEAPEGVVIPQETQARHTAYNEIDKLSKEHGEFISDKDKSLEELLQSLESDIKKIRITEQDDKEGDDR